MLGEILTKPRRVIVSQRQCRSVSYGGDIGRVGDICRVLTSTESDRFVSAVGIERTAEHLRVGVRYVGRLPRTGGVFDIRVREFNADPILSRVGSDIVARRTRVLRIIARLRILGWHQLERLLESDIAVRTDKSQSIR